MVWWWWFKSDELNAGFCKQICFNVSFRLIGKITLRSRSACAMPHIKKKSMLEHCNSVQRKCGHVQVTGTAPMLLTGSSTLVHSSRWEDLQTDHWWFLYFALECMYEYTFHPLMNLSCDPYGSSFQLHCAVTGPLYPQFHIQWYLSSQALDQSTATRLGTSTDDYHIDSNMLNVVGDIVAQSRSISSVLTTGVLEETLQNQCIGCRVEFDDVEISLGSGDNKFCLASPASYISLATCSNGLVVRNSTAVCASPDSSSFQTEFSSSLQAQTQPSHSLLLPSPSPSQPLPLLASSLADPVLSMNMQSMTSHLSSSLMHHPSASISLPTLPSGSNSTPSTSANNSQAAVERGLFVAIGICILFIVIIIILMYFVVRLCRHQWWRREDKEPHDNEDASECPSWIWVECSNVFKSHSSSIFFSLIIS